MFVWTRCGLVNVGRAQTIFVSEAGGRWILRARFSKDEDDLKFIEEFRSRREAEEALEEVADWLMRNGRCYRLTGKEVRKR